MREGRGKEYVIPENFEKWRNYQDQRVLSLGKDLLILVLFHGDPEERTRASLTNHCGWSRRSSGAVVRRNAKKSASARGERSWVIGGLGVGLDLGSIRFALRKEVHPHVSLQLCFSHVLQKKVIFLF